MVFTAATTTQNGVHEALQASPGNPFRVYVPTTNYAMNYTHPSSTYKSSKTTCLVVPEHERKVCGETRNRGIGYARSRAVAQAGANVVIIYSSSKDALQ
ncbi:uncharacterized protein LACBIDRAFT_310726 [Laccaria bicolor S238N-H82]|uniref:Predicted protein n=1 Tax=Laccaria bicolor (strain S238N-H82 / ATCC MYA-4686) TaxID=486041 RepID=B0DUZ2_LACBS|nr:uncharacterized protein LACBIDRAFT_310726 [Laccaria bicolor S238N-H82]EDR01697.1 predicted protein [Laccaria bicolor S238N-H82]|eukprot:XP_001887773.1 predicted protein [Laccaria bicolor S238N-H82]